MSAEVDALAGALRAALHVPSGDGCAASPITHESSWAADMLVNYVGEDDAPEDPDWGPQNTLSKRAVTLACGAFGVGPNAGEDHAHDPEEVERARRLAGEWAAMLPDVYIHMGDEGDHLLRPVWAAARRGGADGASAAAPPPPTAITEQLVRSLLFGGAADPRYPIRVKPVPMPRPTQGADATAGAEAEEAGWVAFRNNVLGIDESYLESEPHWSGNGAGAEGLARWRRAYRWLVAHPELVPGSAVLVSMCEPRRAPPGPPPPPGATVEEQRAHWRREAARTPHGCIFPRVFVALTHAGSVVGVGAVVVHT